MIGREKTKQNKGDPYNTSFEIPTLHLIITTSKSKNNQCGFFLSESLKWDQTRGGKKMETDTYKDMNIWTTAYLHTQKWAFVLSFALWHTHTHTQRTSLPPSPHWITDVRALFRFSTVTRKKQNRKKRGEKAFDLDGIITQSSLFICSQKVGKNKLHLPLN